MTDMIIFIVIAVFIVGVIVGMKLAAYIERHARAD